MVRDVSWKPLFYSPIISKSAHFTRKLALLILLNLFFLFVHEILRTFATVKPISRISWGGHQYFAHYITVGLFLLPNTLYMAAGGFRDNYTLFRIASIGFTTGTDSRHPFSPKGQAAKEY